MDWHLQRQERSTHLERLALHYHEFLEACPADGHADSPHKERMRLLSEPRPLAPGYQGRSSGVRGPAPGRTTGTAENLHPGPLPGEEGASEGEPEAGTHGSTPEADPFGSVDVDLAVGLILDWIESNPPYQPGYWLDSWNSFAVSIRCVCWMQWLANHNHRLAPDIRQRIVASLCEQIRFLERNLELDIRGNHLIKNIKCLLWSGRFFNSPEASRWFARGRQLLFRELDVQFLNDGMHFELSPAYHNQVFADLLECAWVLDEHDRREVNARLAPAAQALADLTHPDGEISLFSDGGLHMAYPPAECLKAYGRIGGDVPKTPDAFGLRDAGYYGLRTPRTFLAVDCGRPCADSLPAHGHGDVLAFEWDVNGRRMFVDPGVYEYEPGERRQWSRSARSHNTLTVGARDQCEFYGSFRVGRRATVQCEQVEISGSRLSLTGSHDGFSMRGERVMHRRRFIADDRGVQVRDEVQGADGQQVVARLLLNNDCRVQLLDEKTAEILQGETRVRLTSASTIRVRQVDWSPDFGHLVPTQQIELDYGAAPCTSGFDVEIVA